MNDKTKFCIKFCIGECSCPNVTRCFGCHWNFPKYPTLQQWKALFPEKGGWKGAMYGLVKYHKDLNKADEVRAISYEDYHTTMINGSFQDNLGYTIPIAVCACFPLPPPTVEELQAIYEGLLK